MNPRRGILRAGEPAPLPVKRKTALRPFRGRLQVEAEPDIWMITLSDLLMLLFVCFVVLFALAMHKQGNRTPASAGEAVQEAALPVAPEEPVDSPVAVSPFLPATADPEPLPDHRWASIRERVQGLEGVTLTEDRNGLFLTFPQHVLFDTGKADLRGEARTVLAAVASLLAEWTDLRAEIRGHTDDRPIRTLRYPSNWELSVDRATRVVQALIGLGVEPYRLSARGFGEFQAALPNDVEDLRAQNRRVEIQLSLTPAASVADASGTS